MEGIGKMEKVHNVLSISSHVVHGYVGNKAMTFPLQSRGWNVDAINTTMFSNHPGYRKFKGSKSVPDLLNDLYDGLMKIECDYDAMIVGYVASKDNLEIVLKIADDYLSKSVDSRSPFVWVLDPVMGDNGKLYVNEDIVPIYKRLMETRRLTLVTPNHFEMEILTDSKINTLDDLKRALTVFHENYLVENVVVTSVELKEFPNTILCVGSIASSRKSFYYQVKPIDAVFSGSGDLFLSLLMDNYFRLVRDGSVHADNVLSMALASTIVTVESVLELTYQIELQKPESQLRHIQDRVYIPDLKIIEARGLLKGIHLCNSDDLQYAPTALDLLDI